MDKFKEELQKRLLAMGTYAVGLAVLAIGSFVRQSAGETEEIRAFMAGMNAGLLAVVVIVLVLTALRYLAALKNEDKRKALYIYENDERRLLIRSKMGGDAIQLVLMALVVATVVSEFFNQTVFFTLLAVLLFTALVKAVFKAVYTGKLR
ncbi:MAG TPA: hypothetical protein P5559_05665 [Candidatus Limiplasma sp.]|nr:hypothetical protein [Candidatus Limiplasma sp.]